MSTITLTVLEFIDANWPTRLQLRERFGCLLDVAQGELDPSLWPYGCSPVVPCFKLDGTPCLACCDGWREHLGAVVRK